ncbi:MAG: hypothetical protein D6731_11460 [Planctomycetota bacterium]|nr:MAG: hypothetical protein D6731_11460 [Planctomycetota bacterium]
MSRPEPALSSLVCVALLCAFLPGCTDEGTSALDKATVAPGQAVAALGPGQVAPAARADDVPDDPSNARVLNAGTTFSGVLDEPSDVDWFAVDLQAGQRISVGFSCYGNARLTVLAPDGTTALHRARPGPARQALAATQSGRFLLRVEAEAGRGLFYDLELR